MEEIKRLSLGELKDTLSELGDIKVDIKTTPSVPSEREMYFYRKKLKTDILPELFAEKSVLGIDIYRYSTYPLFEQSLIPFLFNLIYKEAQSECIKSNEYLFQYYNEENFKEFFINTGDGGFQIFPTPLHAIIFAIYFKLILRAYNSFHFYPKLRMLLGVLSLRYVISYDKIYSFENNYYGPAIINNARLIAKDHLNRCLLDNKTVEWFMLNIHGIENLQIVTLEGVKNLKEFVSYDTSKFDGLNLAIPKDNDDDGIVIATDIQKIGEIKAKAENITIHNLHLQFCCRYSEKVNDNKCAPFIITLGNLNTTGITD